jgi:hypothetical protein
MKGGLFTKRINLPVMSIVLAMLVVLLAGWLLFTLGKREGYKSVSESMDSIEPAKPSESSEEVVVADKKPSEKK